MQISFFQLKSIYVRTEGYLTNTYSRIYYIHILARIMSNRHISNVGPYRKRNNNKPYTRPSSAVFVPPPAPAHFRPPLVHPTGAKALDFKWQIMCDDLFDDIGYTAKNFLESEDRKTLGDEWEDPQKCLREIQSRALKEDRKGTQYLTGESNATTLLVLDWLTKMRNSTDHNDLPNLEPMPPQNQTKNLLQAYLTASEIFMGPSMMFYPDGLAQVSQAFATAGLSAVSPLPKNPK